MRDAPNHLSPSPWRALRLWGRHLRLPLVGMMVRPMLGTIVALLGGLMLFSLGAQAEQVRVAVAANFATPMKQLAAQFQTETGHQAVLSVGASGKLYAQIKSGAPFDVLLSADRETPTRLVQEGAAVAASRFTYATGRLVLWSAQPGLVDGQGEVLKTGQFKHLALAAPQLAPYGAAAVQTLTQLGVLTRVSPRWVQGESIGQTYSFVATGNAELGFVALSQVYANGKISSGSAWVVPETLHSPLHQDAVLLTRGQGNAGAAALLAFLKTDKARAAIRAFGYDTP